VGHVNARRRCLCGRDHGHRGSLPILRLAEQAISQVGHAGPKFTRPPGGPLFFTIGPILGSFVTEPAADDDLRVVAEAPLL